jgi:DNA-binding CsgD family transcriptional regulator
VKLSKRETQVLQHLANGLSSRDVATKLGISYFTVKHHRVRIKQRLGATTFAHAITIARDEHLIEGDPWTS